MALLPQEVTYIFEKTPTLEIVSHFDEHIAKKRKLYYAHSNILTDLTRLHIEINTNLRKGKIYTKKEVN